MFKKFFCKALVVVLAIMITITTMPSVSVLAVEENNVMTVTQNGLTPMFKMFLFYI